MTRVAYFPDSFHEVNGVAHTSRNFEAFARRRGMPFLCVRAASRRHLQKESVARRHGELHTLELRRSRLAVPLERDLWFDPRFLRHRNVISEQLRAFRPDVIHITGPSELGIFGAYFAWKLKVPLVASWHTNVHEYLARRMEWMTRAFGGFGEQMNLGIEGATLNATGRFYRLAKVLYAPNPELCALLERVTGRPCHLMLRGVETETFSPTKRTRAASARQPVLGFVGRLSVEKNVALLPRIDHELRTRGIEPRWMIVGHGAEQAMLRKALPGAEIAGVLRGEQLAEAYANMDLFVFPSHTDTFGNVVLEALASGVPAIVTPNGGPSHIVRDGETGRILPDEGFAQGIAEILGDTALHDSMRTNAREYALSCSWDAVFERVIAKYPATATAEAAQRYSSQTSTVSDGTAN